MCDYSLHNVKSRSAQVGDKLTTRNFDTGTRGFAASEDASMAVCVLPGTELAFTRPVSYRPRRLFDWRAGTSNQTTAIFRQINKDNPHTHHDALEFPDGQIVLLTDLGERQQATVLQLPAQPATAAESCRFRLDWFRHLTLLLLHRRSRGKAFRCICRFSRPHLLSGDHRAALSRLVRARRPRLDADGIFAESEQRINAIRHTCRINVAASLQVCLKHCCWAWLYLLISVPPPQ